MDVRPANWPTKTMTVPNRVICLVAVSVKLWHPSAFGDWIRQWHAPTATQHMLTWFSKNFQKSFSEMNNCSFVIGSLPSLIYQTNVVVVWWDWTCQHLVWCVTLLCFASNFVVLKIWVHHGRMCEGIVQLKSAIHHRDWIMNGGSSVYSECGCEPCANKLQQWLSRAAVLPCLQIRSVHHPTYMLHVYLVSKERQRRSGHDDGDRHHHSCIDGSCSPTVQQHIYSAMLYAINN